MARVKGSISKDRPIDAESLRETLKPIYEELKNKGVKEEDLPSADYLTASLLKFLDSDAINKWSNKYLEWTKNKP
jgi:hypothetical protein